MTPTKEQIERVARWIGEIKGGHNREYFMNCMEPGGEWRAVGHIAEACKAAGVEFSTPRWVPSLHKWRAVAYSIDKYFTADTDCGPSHAAILALDAYLVSKEQPHA